MALPNQHPIRKHIWAISSGIVLASSFPTWNLFPLAWVALVPLLFSIRALTPFRTAIQFFLAGMAFYLVLLQWLMTNVYWAGGWAFWGYLTLCLIMATYWGLLGLIWKWLQVRLPRIPSWLTLPILWAAMEFFQARLLSGFGWGSLAYSQGSDLPLLQWAAIGGGPLVSALLVTVSAVFAQILVRPRRTWPPYLAAILAILAGTHALGWLMMKPADYTSMPFNAGLAQPAFPLEMKWDPEYSVDMVANTAQKSRMVSDSFDIDLFVWPESLVMDSIERPEINQLIRSLTQDTSAALYTGSQREEGAEFFNSSYLFDKEGTIVDLYDKVHLAPFGEYVPFGKVFPFVQRVVPAISDITPGALQKTFTVGQRRFGPLICFEVLFSPMAERLRAAGADFLVVITNLGWFGQSNAIPQELDIARIRAIETRLPLVHCANTGISGVFDPYGRFSLIDIRMDRHGELQQYSGLRPRDIIAARWMGALPVAAPGTRPLPCGPAAFPLLAVAVSALLVGLAAVLTKTALPRGEQEQPK